MNIQICGNHLDLTDSLKNHVESVLSNLDDHFSRITTTKVILSLDNKKHKAEINLHVPGHQLCGKSISSDMYSSISQAAKKVNQQIMKIKNKNHSKFHKRIRDNLEMELE